LSIGAAPFFFFLPLQVQQAQMPQKNEPSTAQPQTICERSGISSCSNSNRTTTTSSSSTTTTGSSGRRAAAAGGGSVPAGCT